MHQLNRSIVPAPPCLTDYYHGANNWGHVKPEHKNELRNHLKRMQGVQCAYCEASLETQGCHIEHFRPKNRFPTLIFAWENLFLSCDSCDHCGHYKDNRAGMYDPKDLIDPTVDDPERFFRFYSDGSIRLRPCLSDTERHRANETIRVFNLDSEHGPLRHMRRKDCNGYVHAGAEIAKLAQECPREEWLAFLHEEISNTSELPFATAIKHILSPE